jgi:hypothetical protein
VIEAPLGWRIGGARRAGIGTSGQPMCVDARVSEPAEHICDVERREIAEPTQTEPAEQLHQLGVALAERLQPPDRQLGTERG